MNTPLTSSLPGPLCLETICVRGGQLQNLVTHQERFDRTRRVLWGIEKPISLTEIISLPAGLLPDQPYKCRVTYGPDIQKIEFELYEIRPVRSLQLVLADGLDYQYKYANREPIQALFAQRGAADDILMVRNGLLTDTSYANVALFDGKRWFTPASPLLAGTQRARLLHEGILTPADISPGDLSQFDSVKLINAMLNWNQTPPISVSAVQNQIKAES